MKKWLSSLVLLFGCGPLAVDFTVGWGSNQSIDKTLKINQKQTRAQTEAGSDALEDILSTIPLLGLSSAPTPTPTPAIKSLTIEFVGAPTPYPTPYPTPVPVRPRPRPPRARLARSTPTPCPSLAPVVDQSYYQKRETRTELDNIVVEPVPPYPVPTK